MTLSNPTNNPICPCCGSTVDPAQILIDDASGIVTFGGQTVRLRALQMRVFRSVASAYPAARSKEQIYDDLYALVPDCDQPGPKIIDVAVCQMRPALASVGLVIGTQWGFGYVLTLANPEALGAIKREGLAAGRQPKLWQDAHDETIAELARQGYGLVEIARRVGIGYMATDRAMKRLGLTREVAA